ncbi:RHS repeat-associated core domain-containing protein [Pedobacter nyackensis]|uniref:RHS repeat-associated core domain-containing protein n=1 Tax=Pedobacter nyackensis TaxID=475255 RepID=UPI00292E937B|nr:RHS repeat-associated core domain-containing protein [Pedobacter nyackensis]
MMPNAFRSILSLFCLMLLFAGECFAGVEPYENFIKGQIRKNDSLQVKDEKFKNPQFNWADITNISVQNSIALRILDEEAISRSFSCKLKLKIEYFSDPEQVKATLIDSVSLNVNYNKEAGAVYQGKDVYKFINGYAVKITVIDINSPEFGSEIPPVLELSSQIVIDRKYVFRPFLPLELNGELSGSGTNAGLRSVSTGTVNGNNLSLTWAGAVGDEEFDVEWVTIDQGSEWSLLADSMNTNKLGSYDARIGQMFRNNAARITTTEHSYLISLIYNANYIAVRMRQAHYVDGIRIPGDWFYKKTDNKYAIWELSTWHEEKLNWQYSASYAEGGKKKEVVSYFDGSLRGRQTVTLSNSGVDVVDGDKTVAVVQENIYDQFGRAAASILPAPVKGSGVPSLQYFHNLNLNSKDSTYNFLDLNSALCEPNPKVLKVTSGAAKYYSSGNDFKALRPYNMYIPDAQGYPLSVTQYTADNTGRIKIQGGVGPVFQPGTPGQSRTTKYFYGKPEQWEIDRLFGNDVGYAEHYLKNMVVDPNGQISISYLNAGGKTIATALTGSSPDNVDSLSTIAGEKRRKTRILKPEQFRFDGSSLKLSATTTYMAAVTGSDTLQYSVKKLISLYGQQGNFKPCSNCHYKLTITVNDDCGNPIALNKVMPISIGSDTANCNDNGLAEETLVVNFTSIGSYYITFEFALDKTVIENFTDTYITSAQDAGVIKKKQEFIVKHFRDASFIDCFADCKTARKKLGTLTDFSTMFKNKLIDLGEEEPNSYTSYISELHQSLSRKVDTLEMKCISAPVSPCEIYRTPMLADVSPGGQYALMDALGNFIEPEVNVITSYFKNGVFNNGTTTTDSIYIVTKDNGTTATPYDSNFSIEDLKKYWRPEWAELFLPFHPEYCKLLFCNENAVSMNWDEKLRNTDAHADIPSVASPAVFSNTLSDWLLTADPFFKTVKGAPYLPAMRADLNNYSSNVLGLSLAKAVGKGLSQFVDYQLYCADSTATTYQTTSDRWTNCAPKVECRVRDREWQLYRDLYLDLKQKYFEQSRSDSTCKNICVVGTPVSLPPKGNTVNECSTVLTLGAAGKQLNANQFVAESGTTRNTYTLVKGTPGVTPGVPNVCSGSNGTPIFYPCLSILMPNGTYRKFTNVWRFICTETIPPPCANEGSVFSSSPITNNKFYVIRPYGNFNRDHYTIISGYSQNNRPNVESCDDSSDLYFYNCYTVYDNIGNELASYRDVWIHVCYDIPNCEEPLTYHVDHNYYHDGAGNYQYTNSVINVDYFVSKVYPSTSSCNGRFPTINFYSCLSFYNLYGQLLKDHTNVWLLTCDRSFNRSSISPDSLDTITANTQLPTQIFQSNNFVDADKKAHETIITNIHNNQIYSIINADSINTTTVLPYAKPVSKISFSPYEYKSTFLIEIAHKAFRKLKNVWVATYLSPENLKAENIEEAALPFTPNALQAPCPAVLSTKKSHFTSVNRTTPSSNIDALEVFNNAESELQDSIASFCKNNADMWMKRLDTAVINNSQVDTALLRLKLIELCSMGGDASHPFGASSLKSGSILVNGIRCSSFGEIIKVIFGIQKFTRHVNPWLIESPYPYTPVQHATEKIISSTSNELCTAINQLKPNGATNLQFYNHLKTEYGAAMTLNFDDFDALLAGCGNCKFLLKKDIQLPQFLIPGGKGCITRTEYTNAMDSLSFHFSDVPSATWYDYETIVTNYLNFKWGFSFSYDQYQDFANTPTRQKLCNEALFTSFEEDPYACIKTAIEVAHGQATREYLAYINEERDKFRNAYVSDCAAAKPSVDLTAKEKIYHYTLYYYDLAGNLIRTVPPEGVNPLSDIETALVDKARQFEPDLCTYNGPTANAIKTDAFQSLSNTLAYDGNAAVEMWLHQNDNLSRQMLVTTTDTKYMFQASINDKLLSIDIYTLRKDDATSVSIIHSNHAQVNIASLLPLVPWTHIVVQGNKLASGSLELWVNGKRYPVVATSPGSGSTWTITSLPSLQLPENIANLKHLRMYNGRLLTANEIKENAESGCFRIFDNIITNKYRFNVPLAGGITLAEGTNVETQFNPTFPLNGLTTTYAYNSTNQVIRQASPDGGTSRFWYDELSRLVISQNAKQTIGGKYSYTDYDNLGRIREVGEKTVTDATLTTPEQQATPGYLTDVFYRGFLTRGNDTELTQTIYDVPAVGPGIDVSVAQSNLRKRVAASVYRPTRTSTSINASYYNYDLSGNVKTLYQQLAGLDSTRTLNYEYDLVSGKVNLLAYQHGKRDRFYYKYNYDAENRLIAAYTSDSVHLDPYGFRSTIFTGHERLDAKYEYYLHGPLARMELGREEQKVQGVDYVYTLQGWLKGVNGNKLSGAGIIDVGNDKATIAKDALAYSLGYYPGDYVPIGGAGSTAFNMNYQPGAGDITGQSLYNGNISSSTYAIESVGAGNTVGYTYKYDQLNRLKKLRQHNLSSATGTWAAGTISLNNYSEDFDYDGNGNILALKRNGAGSTMDQLAYGYNRDANLKLLNNKLGVLTDGASSNTTDELKGTNNYRYDEIGNLIEEKKDGALVAGFDWTVYGKIAKVNKTNPAENIVYGYDPTGNRVSKTINNITTWYVRDAQGNSLAVYDNKSGGVNWREQQLYGSSRLGMWKPNFNLAKDSIRFKWNSTGLKFFELNNHLGNVMSVINDDRTGGSGNYAPIVINAQDYYAFGSMMPGRTHTLGSSSAYRYGFNGKENDNEVKGTGNQQDYGMRIYDPRIAKFLSVDPLTKEYPWYTPYQFAGNNPIKFVDLDGAEEYNPGEDPFFIGKLVLTTWYDTKHSIENIVLNKFYTPKDPGKKWLATYKVNKNGDPIFETVFKLVPRQGVLVEGLETALDLVNIAGRSKIDATDFLSVKTEGKAQSTKAAKNLLDGFVKKAHYMSDIAKRYQSQISGLAGDIDYRLNKVHFDGMKDGVLLEAKGLGYKKLLKNEKTRDNVLDNLLNQAERQVDAAKGKKLEWHFAEKEAADDFSRVLRENKIEGIDVKHTPIKFEKSGN